MFPKAKARVGAVIGEGKCKSFYVHHDGHPEGVGNILLKHYTNPKIVASMMKVDLPYFSQILYPTSMIYCNNIDDNISFRRYTDTSGGSVSKLRESVASRAHWDEMFCYFFDGTEWFVWETNKTWNTSGLSMREILNSCNGSNKNRALYPKNKDWLKLEEVLSESVAEKTLHIHEA